MARNAVFVRINAKRHAPGSRLAALVKSSVEVEAPDVASAKAAAAVQFGLDEIQRGRVHRAGAWLAPPMIPRRDNSRRACRRSSSGQRIKGPAGGRG